MKNIISLLLLIPTMMFSQTRIKYAEVKKPTIVTITSCNDRGMIFENDFQIVKSSTGHTFILMGYAHLIIHDPDCLKCIRRQLQMIENAVNKKKK